METATATKTGWVLAMKTGNPVGTGFYRGGYEDGVLVYCDEDVTKAKVYSTRRQARHAASDQGREIVRKVSLDDLDKPITVIAGR